MTALALSLLKRFWKPLAIGLVLIVAVIAFRAWLGDVRADAYRDGEQAAEQRHQQALNRANAANRQRERKLESDLNDFGRRFETLAGERHQREEVIVTRMNERIDQVEDCAIDPEIIKMRNEMRSMK